MVGQKSEKKVMITVQVAELYALLIMLPTVVIVFANNVEMGR